MYANVYSCVCMLFWHGNGAMLEQKSTRKLCQSDATNLHPLYFMKFSAKLIVLKSYCETSLSTTTATTTLSTASSFDIVVLVHVFVYIVTALFMYIQFVCASLSSSWFVYLQSIQNSLCECERLYSSHFCIHKSSTQPVNNGFMDTAFQNSSIINPLKLLKRGWDRWREREEEHVTVEIWDKASPEGRK